MALSGLVIALILKVCGIFIGSFGIQFLSYILSNEIWFVLGMCLSSFGFSNYINSKKVLTPIYGLGIFLILSVLVYIFGLSHGLVGFLLGLLACASIVLLVGILYKKKKTNACIWLFGQIHNAYFLDAYIVCGTITNSFI